jgi:hypothetical protein
MFLQEHSRVHNKSWRSAEELNFEEMFLQEHILPSDRIVELNATVSHSTADFVVI